MTSVNVNGGGVPSVQVSGNQVIASASSGQVSASVSVGPFVATNGIPEPPEDGIAYGRRDRQWTDLGIPGYVKRLSDIANTSGDIAGSSADTGQPWSVSGDGTLSPKKPFYLSDELGGYMRATDIDSGSANTYIIGSLSPDNCTRLAVTKRGALATLSILKASSFDDMLHINFTQASGGASPAYWKTGVGVGVAFAYAWLGTNPTADPDQARLYEIEVSGDFILCYTDGVLTGVISDPVVRELVGPGFYTQLHQREDRIYKIEAWTSSSVAGRRKSAWESAALETKHIQTPSIHVGDATATEYAPVGNAYFLSDTPTFRGRNSLNTLTALFRSTGSGATTRLRVHNGAGQGMELQVDGGFAGVIKHQNGDRIAFPANTSRVDFPVAVKARSVAHVVALTYGETVATDATAGDVFDLTLTGNATLSNPTNPINGKTLTWRILQDATGGHAVTLGDKFATPTTITSPLPWEDTANTLTILSATYHLARDKWDIVSFNAEY